MMHSIHKNSACRKRQHPPIPLLGYAVTLLLGAAVLLIGCPDNGGSGNGNGNGNGGGDGDTTTPSEVSNFSATPGNGAVTLNWTNPTVDDFAKVTIGWTPPVPSVLPLSLPTRSRSSGQAYVDIF